MMAEARKAAKAKKPTGAKKPAKAAKAAKAPEAAEVAKAAKVAKAKNIRIRQIRSGIGRPEKQRLVLRGLGFRHLNQVVEHPDTPATRGMVFKVKHLVEVLE